MPSSHTRVMVVGHGSDKEIALLKNLRAGNSLAHLYLAPGYDLAEEGVAGRANIPMGNVAALCRFATVSLVTLVYLGEEARAVANLAEAFEVAGFEVRDVE